MAQTVSGLWRKGASGGGILTSMKDQYGQTPVGLAVKLSLGGGFFRMTPCGAGGGLRHGGGIARIFGQKFAPAVQTPRADLTRGNGRAHRAIGFGQMFAIAKAAVAGKFGKVLE